MPIRCTAIKNELDLFDPLGKKRINFEDPLCRQLLRKMVMVFDGQVSAPIAASTDITITILADSPRLILLDDRTYPRPKFPFQSQLGDPSPFSPDYSGISGTHPESGGDIKFPNSEVGFSGLDGSWLVSGGAWLAYARFSATSLKGTELPNLSLTLGPVGWPLERSFQSKAMSAWDEILGNWVLNSAEIWSVFEPWIRAQIQLNSTND